MKKRYLALILVLVAGAAACGSDEVGDDTVAASGPEVSISGFAFGPETLTVSVGETVSWKNEDQGIIHTSTAEGLWSSGSLEGGGTFSQTFDTAGTFEYFCSVHPTMTGTIVVEG